VSHAYCVKVSVTVYVCVCVATSHGWLLRWRCFAVIATSCWNW